MIVDISIFIFIKMVTLYGIIVTFVHDAYIYICMIIRAEIAVLETMAYIGLVR